MTRPNLGKQPRLRPWIIEKGIDLPSLVNTHVSATVATRQWVRYVQRPPKPNRNIMTKFYASTVSERFNSGGGGAILVQGIKVYITPDVITHYFTAPYVNVNDVCGIDWIKKFDQFQERMVEALRMDGEERWEQGFGLYRRDVQVDVAFWNTFLTYSLIPPQYHTEIFYEKGRLLHRLKTGRPIDIGLVIFRAIYNCGHNDSTSMVFPCFITAFYQ
ncbi:hypothetical protein Dsin_000365 [Dipteronia sinensis]|uniref:Putative plant transposon protein domain-containing protein n=1 Tax=Dipteronia sinensis TaxID=43782 RepID=A0AAE0B3I4_9ROSI|nr:hypothetical protein Dsin_000365 [Dipteronia sinensis]